VSVATPTFARPLTRGVPWQETTRNVRAALLPVAILVPVAAANGGYFPTSWGWTAIALSWAAVVAVLVRPLIRVSPLERLALGGLAGLAAWTLISALWSPADGRTALAFELTLVYVAGLAAAVLIVRSGSYRALLGGITVATALVTSYSALTRLAPNHFPLAQAIAGNRLATPLGYWNALGLFAVLGLLLACGFAAHGRSKWVQAAAATALVPQSLTLYFTFSRGAWVALFAGLAVAVAFDPRRLKFLFVLLLVAPWPALAVAVASQQQDLTQAGTLGPAAVAQGRHVTLVALLAAAVAGGLVLALAQAERRVNVPRSVARGFAAMLACAALLTLAAVFATYGSPATLVQKGWHAFNAPPVRADSNLNSRLFTFSGSWRTDLWKTSLADFRDHPLLGSGAGTYRQEWLQRRTVGTDVINAHNLYFETLAELGPVGLVLLLVALACPLAAALRARSRTLVPAATAAYIAFLVHAFVDWDWQLPAVTLAALFIGAALMSASRRDDRARDLSNRTRTLAVVGLLAIGLLSAIGLVGNRALDASAKAKLAERYGVVSSEARTAHRWAPWDSAPLQQLGEAQLQQGRLGPARRLFEQALAKDRKNSELWLDLALASKGRARLLAALEAQRLNPLSSGLDPILTVLGLPTRKAS
jgi:hypothetical protein